VCPNEFTDLVQYACSVNIERRAGLVAVERRRNERPEPLF
jgi:hypothetical protein